MTNAHRLMITALMLCFAGCHGTPAPTSATSDAWVRYHLSFFDDNNQLIAAGSIDLPRVWPPAGQSFVGEWHLKSAGSSFPADATHDGKYSGYVDSRSISIDLNPGAVNHNVMLSTDPVHDELSGNWILTNVGGGKPMGNFALRR